jgi:hypothetical protein
MLQLTYPEETPSHMHQKHMKGIFTEVWFVKEKKWKNYEQLK